MDPWNIWKHELQDPKFVLAPMVSVNVEKNHSYFSVIGQ